MVAQPGLVVLDSNLFVIDLRYPRDPNYRANKAFLAEVPTSTPAATTLVNLLEVCGILSFNLTSEQVWELYHYLPDRYRVSVLPPAILPASLAAIPVGRLLELIAKKLSFGDALIALAIELWIPGATCFVSWDARHFRGKMSLPVKTPREYLQDFRRAGLEQ